MNLRAVLSRRKTSFQPTGWDIIDADELVEAFPLLQRIETLQQETLGRSLVRDALYALSGISINEQDALSAAWRQVTSEPSFSTMRTRANGRVATAMQAVHLSGILERALREKAQEEQPDQPLGQSSEAVPEEHVGEEDLPEWLQRIADADQQSMDEEMPRTSLEDTSQPVDPGTEDQPVDLDSLLRMGAELEQGANGEQIQVDIPSGSLEEASDKAANLTAIVNGLEASLTGRPNERLAAALDLTPLFDVELFARLLGWSKRIVRGAMQESRSASGELTGYRPDIWSDAVTAAEMLAVADGRLDALSRLAEGSLETTEHHERVPLGRGPLIVFRDESGSMWPGADAHDGDATFTGGEHRRALSLEVALSVVFNAEGRDLVSVRWGSHPEEPYTYGDPGLEQHLRSFQDGGTRIVDCLPAAIAVADEYALDADILVLTDANLTHGSGHLGSPLEITVAGLQEIAAPFRDLGGRIWVVVIGQTEEHARPLMEGWVDGWATIEQIAESEGLGEIIRALSLNELQEGAKRRL